MGRYSSLSAIELVNACCAASDAEAWEEFVVRFHRPISLSVIRTTYQWSELPRREMDDLVQETYFKLCIDKCRLLGEFAAQHPESILGYIKTIAANVVHDYFKARNSLKRGAGRDRESLDTDPPASSDSLGSPATMERQLLLKQIDECLGASVAGADQERDRLIFWLYYQQGMTAKAIAALPTVGLTAKGVESAILRLTRLVREQVANSRSKRGDESKSQQKGLRSAESY